MTAEEIRYVQAPGMVFRRVAGEPLLVRVAGRSPMPLSRGADLLVLNATGEKMWEWLAQARTVGELARNLIAEFDVSEDVASDDVLAFLRAMEEAGAVTPMKGTGT